MVRRGGRVSKSQPAINRRTFPPLNRRNDLISNLPNIVNTALPQAGVQHLHVHQQEVTLPPQQQEAQPDQQAVPAAGQAAGGGAPSSGRG